MASKAERSSPGGGIGVRRRTRTPSAHIARKLLHAAEAVLVREGIAGLTVRAVAAEAGVAPMGVYSCLGGKGGLVTALLIRGFDRLRETIEVGGEPEAYSRLRVCCLRYREFALANPCLYPILFEAGVSREHESAEVKEHAAACLGVLVGNVELAAMAGVLVAPDAREAARQIWSALHGAVALELTGLVQTPDPAATYRGVLDTVLRGLVCQPPRSTPGGGLRLTDGAESNGQPRVGILVGHHRDQVQESLFRVAGCPQLRQVSSLHPPGLAAEFPGESGQRVVAVRWTLVPAEQLGTIPVRRLFRGDGGQQPAFTPAYRLLGRQQIASPRFPCLLQLLVPRPPAALARTCAGQDGSTGPGRRDLAQVGLEGG